MNSKERILTALKNKEPNKMPIFELYINEASIVNLAEVLRREMVTITEKDISTSWDCEPFI